MDQPGTLVLIMAAAVLAPLLAYGFSRWLAVPLVIFEILLGILMGPDALGWASSGQVIDVLSQLGLAMLIFLGVYIGTALTSTALGAILPVLRDAGDLKSRFGAVMMAMGSVGEFGPIIAMALLLSGRAPARSAALLVAFGLLTAAAVFWALRPKPPWFSRVIARTLHSSAQFAVRMLMLVGMLALAQALGLDILLGAFAAGLITRLVLQGAAPESSGTVLSKVEALGFGFLVPLFFVVTGIEFDLEALLGGGWALLLVPVFLLLFVVVRGLPMWLLAPRDLGRRDRSALVLFGSTALPLVVAITTMGVQDGKVESGEAAALVGAGMLSVLVFPLVGLRLRAGSGTGSGSGSGSGSGRPAPGPGHRERVVVTMGSR
ncbi:cation:proton antiporter [Streptomyces antarcticus]|uniref:cation:proton antiporter n=1 Tax=Streptomyces antarcticus TaxID=2996458 RepID=UPI00227049EC|nr:cation:proton antiporter [Streptomyces sp. H34-AA3]MCY0942299.1 cation:proton antiporter [Streptomyces sp. H34-AA3]